MTLKCEYEKFGCQELIKLENIIHHESLCKFNTEAVSQKINSEKVICFFLVYPKLHYTNIFIKKLIYY